MSENLRVPGTHTRINLDTVVRVSENLQVPGTHTRNYPDMLCRLRRRKVRPAG